MQRASSKDLKSEIPNTAKKTQYTGHPDELLHGMVLMSVFMYSCHSLDVG